MHDITQSNVFSIKCDRRQCKKTCKKHRRICEKPCEKH